MVIHGGVHPVELQSLGVNPAEVLDFSVNSNPYGPSPRMRAAVRQAPLETYPDPHATRARESMAAHLGVPAECIALGPGAADLLWSLARLLAGPQRNVWVVEPTFGEFAAAVHATGGTVRTWRALAPSFSIDLNAVSAALGSAQVVYLCAPNTPTGYCVPICDIAAFAARHPHTTLVLDQSFLSLSTHHRDAAQALPANVIRVRSLTKDHALCGVRVGYVLASQARVAQIAAMRPAWSTSSMAQAAACVAPEEHEFVAVSRDKMLQSAMLLQEKFKQLGLMPLASTTPFFITQVPQSANLRRRLLLRHRVLVRDCASFGLSNTMRVCSRTPPDDACLVQALREEL